MGDGFGGSGAIVLRVARREVHHHKPGKSPGEASSRWIGTR
jgi:hypothetical protein